MRSGFTLVELVVAIVILTIGLLALAATAGIVASHVGDGGRLTGAAHAARSVIDSLAGQPCARLTSGSSAPGGVVVSWAVSTDSSAATVNLTVGSRLRRGRRRDTFQAVVPCRRA
ncbi:MAG TPA: prepilin-type N-terminal cleavage/methylation domain-containing protein [Gemmatimonadaceae bacterium]|nr:prepilin-type N-terminal cleavage/methylation domain-containing protein [Gemmatimonadaceae bacterium]